MKMWKHWKKSKGCHMRKEHPTRMLNREMTMTSMPMQPGFHGGHPHHHHGHGAPWLKKKHLKFHKHKFARCNFHGHHFYQHGFHGPDDECNTRSDDYQESDQCGPSNHEHSWHRYGHHGLVVWICGQHGHCCDVQRNQGADASQRQNETNVPNVGEGEPSAPQE